MPFNTQHLTGNPTKSWLNLLENKTPGQGRNLFVGSSSNLNLLLEPQSENGTFHYTLPPEIGYTSSRLNELDNEEIEILKFRGAFLLPPRDLCDDIVEAYFEKIHPTMPFLNRSQFMRRYNDLSNPPSLLLIQSMLLAGSRVCNNPALFDSSGSPDLASLTFYKRAKALFDANYEKDSVVVVQSVMMLGWWWEGPEDVTKNSFYWSRVGLTIAQGFGLHRSVEHSTMPISTKRTWKRMWWSLFQRDRWVAVSLGRPVMINLEDSDVPMLTEDDFNEDEANLPSLYPVNRVNVLYFIHSVKLSEIMGLVLRQQFSVNAETSRRQNKVPVVSHCDLAMGSWMNNLPAELKYSVKDKVNHHLLKALLHAQYYTVLCLVHRSNILRKGMQPSKDPYPSWGIAFQAAHMISRIFENIAYFDECKDIAAFYVYTLFSAMIMLLYQIESPQQSVIKSAKKALGVCTKALTEMGKTWLIARMILQLFKQLHQNRAMREQFVTQAQKRPYDTAFLKDYPVTKPGDKGKGEKGKEEWKYDSEKALSADQSTKFENNGTGPARVTEQHLLSNLQDTPRNIDNMFAASKTLPSNNTIENSSNMWKSATSKISSVRHTLVSPPKQEDSEAFHRHQVYETPDFMMFTNNLPNSPHFYDNFQPSQLFPEISDTDLFMDTIFSYGNAGEDNTDQHAKTQNHQPSHHPRGTNSMSPTNSTTSSSNDMSQLSPTSRSNKIRDWYNYVTSTFQIPSTDDDHHIVTTGTNSVEIEGLGDIISVASSNVSKAELEMIKQKQKLMMEKQHNLQNHNQEKPGSPLETKNLNEKKDQENGQTEKGAMP